MNKQIQELRNRVVQLQNDLSMIMKEIDSVNLEQAQYRLDDVRDALDRELKR